MEGQVKLITLTPHYGGVKLGGEKKAFLSRLKPPPCRPIHYEERAKHLLLQPGFMLKGKPLWGRALETLGKNWKQHREESVWILGVVRTAGGAFFLANHLIGVRLNMAPIDGLKGDKGDASLLTKMLERIEKRSLPAALTEYHLWAIQPCLSDSPTNYSIGEKFSPAIFHPSFFPIWVED